MRTAIGRANGPRRHHARRLMGAARWGVLAACLAAAVAVLVGGGRIGEQRQPPPALRGLRAGRRAGRWTARGSCAAITTTGELPRWAGATATSPGARSTVPFVAQRRRTCAAWPASARSRARIAWYRTTVTVPRAGVYAIRFESVNHVADVWVDGRLVTRHTGTYLPFEARVRLRRRRRTSSSCAPTGATPRR